jgi:hypothetical protein
MNKKALIHIGTGKTGSTSIQNTLAKHYDNLSQCGIGYHLITGQNYHNNLISLYREYSRLPRSIKSQFPQNKKHELITVPARVRYGDMVTARSVDEGPVLNACDHRYKREVSEYQTGFFDALSQNNNVILSSEYMSAMSIKEKEQFTLGVVIVGAHIRLRARFISRQTTSPLSSLSFTIDFTAATTYRALFRHCSMSTFAHLQCLSGCHL